MRQRMERATRILLHGRRQERNRGHSPIYTEKQFDWRVRLRQKIQRTRVPNGTIPRLFSILIPGPSHDILSLSREGKNFYPYPGTIPRYPIQIPAYDSKVSQRLLLSEIDHFSCTLGAVLWFSKQFSGGGSRTLFGGVHFWRIPRLYLKYLK